LVYYAFRAHNGYDSTAATKFGIESTQPLLALPPPRKNKSPYLRVEPANVIATVLKPSDDGKAAIWRLFNPRTKPQKPT